MPEEDPEKDRMIELFNRKREVFMVKTNDEDDSDTEVPRYMSHVYDPGNIKSEFAFPNLSAYSPALLKEIDVSKHRYMHYIEDPDGIRHNEISKYNKEWMSNSLNLIYPSSLLKTYTQTVKDLFQEVLDTYAFSMKKAILDYILRSPDERKRLHILMIPREVPSSSDKIAVRGGYSTKIFTDWHKAKKDSENEIKLKMICNNIVMASLNNWWYDFRSIKLVRFNGIKEF
jgi:dynein heavy chain, axonemal